MGSVSRETEFLKKKKKMLEITNTSTGRMPLALIRRLDTARQRLSECEDIQQKSSKVKSQQKDCKTVISFERLSLEKRELQGHPFHTEQPRKLFSVQLLKERPWQLCSKGVQILLKLANRLCHHSFEAGFAACKM
jgi:ABC-type phosphate transport system auxiliary subunit